MGVILKSSHQSLYLSLYSNLYLDHEVLYITYWEQKHFPLVHVTSLACEKIDFNHTKFCIVIIIKHIKTCWKENYWQAPTHMNWALLDLNFSSHCFGGDIKPHVYKLAPNLWARSSPKLLRWWVRVSLMCCKALFSSLSATVEQNKRYHLFHKLSLLMSKLQKF